MKVRACQTESTLASSNMRFQCYVMVSSCVSTRAYKLMPTLTVMQLNVAGCICRAINGACLAMMCRHVLCSTLDMAHLSAKGFGKRSVVLAQDLPWTAMPNCSCCLHQLGSMTVHMVARLQFICMWLAVALPWFDATCTC